MQPLLTTLGDAVPFGAGRKRRSKSSDFVLAKRAIVGLLLVLAGGCDADATTSPDLSVGPPDLGDTLALSDGKTVRPLTAYYSFYIEPLPDNGEPQTDVMITAVDPAFDCANPSPSLDALAFLFYSRSAGATTTTIASRRGPTLGATIGGDALGTILGESDRFGGYDLDAGTVTLSSSDGEVSGRLRFVDGNITVTGLFVAHHCAALDAIVGG